MAEIILPFKPFSLEEVSAITGVSGKTLDIWVKHILPLQKGDDGISTGLNYMQTLAVFTGGKYLEEGADTFRASSVVAYIGHMDIRHFETEMGKGNTFPAPANMASSKAPLGTGVMTPTPDNVLGKRLCMVKLFAEFRERVERVFPSGKQPSPILQPSVN